MILFDLDGTLIDSISGIYRSYQFSIEGMNREVISENNFRRFIGASYDKMITNIYNDLSKDSKEHKEIVDKFRYMYDTEGYQQYKIFSDSKELFEYLKTIKMSIGIVSNKKQEQVKQIIEMSFREFSISGFGKTDNHWKKKEQCKLIAKKEKVWAFIGDTKEDYECAQELGCSFIYAGYGYGELTSSKIRTCSSLLEVKDELEKILIINNKA